MGLAFVERERDPVERFLGTEEESGMYLNLFFQLYHQIMHYTMYCVDSHPCTLLEPGLLMRLLASLLQFPSSASGRVWVCVWVAGGIAGEVGRRSYLPIHFVWRPCYRRSSFVLYT